MKLLIFALLSTTLIHSATAQLKFKGVAMEGRVGTSFTHLPARMTGAPATATFTFSAQLSKGWSLMAEGGSTAFRDAYYREKMGLIISSYIRHKYSYAGCLVGKTLINTSKTLRFSTGADALWQTTPQFTSSNSYFFNFGPHVDYTTKLTVNWPLQLDYMTPLGGSQWYFLINGRYNINRFHSFPALTTGIGVNLYGNKTKS